MDVKAADIMTRDVICVQASTTLQELVEFFFSKPVGGVPVVKGEKLVGIISKTDLVTHGLEKELSSILGEKMKGSSSVDLPDFENLLGPDLAQETVGQVMKSPVITAKPSTNVSEIVRIMLDKKIHRIVITENKKVVGIITSMDLLRLLDTEGSKR